SPWHLAGEALAGGPDVLHLREALEGGEHVEEERVRGVTRPLGGAQQVAAVPSEAGGAVVEHEHALEVPTQSTNLLEVLEPGELAGLGVAPGGAAVPVEEEDGLEREARAG